MYKVEEDFEESQYDGQFKLNISDEDRDPNRKKKKGFNTHRQNDQDSSLEIAKDGVTKKKGKSPARERSYVLNQIYGGTAKPNS